MVCDGQAITLDSYSKSAMVCDGQAMTLDCYSTSAMVCDGQAMTLDLQYISYGLRWASYDT